MDDDAPHLLLLGLSVLANVDIDEIAALHPVNALVIAGVAYALMERSRHYLASKMAA